MMQHIQDTANHDEEDQRYMILKQMKRDIKAGKHAMPKAFPGTKSLFESARAVLNIDDVHWDGSGGMHNYLRNLCKTSTRRERSGREAFEIAGSPSALGRRQARVLAPHKLGDAWLGDVLDVMDVMDFHVGAPLVRAGAPLPYIADGVHLTD